MAGPRSLVVDASVAAKWHLPDEEHVNIANDLLVRFSRGELELVAPDLIRHEVASAITVATLGRAPRLSLREGREAIADFVALDVATHATTASLTEAFDLVHLHGCALYDAVYLALAQRLSIPFVTVDRRLHQRVGHLPEVIWLADYAPVEAAGDESLG